VSTLRKIVRERRWTAAAVVLAVWISADGMAPRGAGAVIGPTLQAVTVPGYSGVLANSAGMTLYVLNTEKGSVIHCHPTCLQTWIPLEVPTATTSVSLGPGVHGAIGFVARTSTKKQVTFNSYPLYRYVKDTAVGQAGGEDLSSYAGTWLMARAAASTATDTLVYPMLQSRTAGKYASVLANRSSRSLYLLSTEKGSVVHCTGTCLSSWIPLVVHSKATTVTIGRDVDGRTALLARATNLFQVTYNSYPVYAYVGDSAPGQTRGEGLVASGGTWYLVRASATTAGSTPILTPTYP
jgi:predicted lipoprotein with Yx(FWY)xxD motif